MTMQNAPQLPAAGPAGLAPSAPAAAALAVVAAATLAIAKLVSPAQALLFLTGAALGLSLYHAGFGFTYAYRVLMADGRSAGVRAQMVMLGLACILFFPALATGTLFGTPVGGFVVPAGTAVAAGGVIFGIGMQLGGACASGTLFTTGGGNVRMAVTLVFFIAGSVIGLEHLPWWLALPAPPAISVVEKLGWPAALAINLGLFAAIWLIVARIEKRRHGVLEPIAAAKPGAGGLRRIWTGPWPLLAGAIALALLNFATLYQAGRPWGITSAFALWGAKIMAVSGFDMSQWASWASAGQQQALRESVLKDVTSVMNFGIMLGAMAAAVLAGKFSPSWRVPLGQVAASVIGGLMLGY
ncbi:MAG: YeeE/YedE family protein, partial [Beijerinckiaceae bacterium]